MIIIVNFLIVHLRHSWFESTRKFSSKSGFNKVIGLGRHFGGSVFKGGFFGPPPRFQGGGQNCQPIYDSVRNYFKVNPQKKKQRLHPPNKSYGQETSN